MKRLRIVVITGLLALGMASIANAAALNWTGTATFLWGEYPRGEFTGGGVATINGSDGVIPAHLNTLRLAASRGQVSGTFTRVVTDPKVWGNGCSRVIFSNVRVGTGTWSGLSGGAASTGVGGGILPVHGIVKFCLIHAECTQYLPLILNQPTTMNRVPGTDTQGVGVGGLITAGGYGGIKISLQAAPWTLKTVTVFDQIQTPPSAGVKQFVPVVAKGWAHAPVSTTTSTAQPGGVVQLVTPNQVWTNLPLGSEAKIGSFVIVAIHFIPEPGLLLLLGSGVAGLAFLGRSRMRKQANG